MNRCRCGSSIIYTLENVRTLKEIYVTVKINSIPWGSSKIGREMEEEFKHVMVHSSTMDWFFWKRDNDTIREMNEQIIMTCGYLCALVMGVCL